MFEIESSGFGALLSGISGKHWPCEELAGVFDRVGVMWGLTGCLDSLVLFGLPSPKTVNFHVELLLEDTRVRSKEFLFPSKPHRILALHESS